MIERMGFETNKRFTKSYNARGEWVDIGGKHFWVDSQEEKKLACYLEILKRSGHIRDWAREQTTFTTKTDGDPFWKVDFDVLNNDGSFEYYEFKGVLEKNVYDKLALLRECRPEVKLTMIFSSKSMAAKYLRRKISKHYPAKIQTAKGLIDFDGRTRCIQRKK
jgi:NMD protein affecting ribosome stability and mRNA decay